MHRIRTPILVALAALVAAAPAEVSAQDDGWVFGFAAEATNAYVWRGLELGDAFSIQPDLSVERGAFFAGVWSNWTLGGNEIQEIDTYLGVYTEGDWGSLTLMATDYFYPSEDGDWTDFGGVEDDEATGSHTIELGAEYGFAALPLTLMAGMNVWNDPDNAIWAAVQLDRTLGPLDASAQLGFLVNDSPNYYEAESFDLYNLDLSLTHTFEAGDWSPYVRAGYVRSLAFEEDFWLIAFGF